MSIFTPIMLVLLTAVLLILFGSWLGRAITSPTAAGGGIEQAELPLERAADLAWLTKEEAIDQLKALRCELEMDGDYGRSQALLLFDVGAYLGLDEGELQTIVGAVWVSTIVDEPFDLDLQDS